CPRRAAVPRARRAAHARPARGLREVRGAGRPARRAAAAVRAQRARDPHLHPAADGLMPASWRASHYAVAGALVVGGLAWASRDAWPWRRPLIASPIVVDAAYADLTATLGRRETLSDVLARGGVTGRDYAAFLAAAQSLPVRRLRPGLKFQLRRLKTESVASRVMVRLSPEGERRFGRILAARVDVARTPQYAFYFEDADAGVTGFYDERGRSLRRAFLRAPLQFRRVSSGFGSRYHPLLHTWRHHEGVDFAAPYGTPVRATADGIVTRVGREDGGYGNVID